MNAHDRLRLELLRAEERYEDAVRQQVEANLAVARRHEEVSVSRAAYVRALERLVSEMPDSAQTPAHDSDRWTMPGAEFQIFVLQSCGARTDERIIAQRAIEQMGPNVLEPLLRIIAAERAKREVRIQIVCSLLVALAVSAVLLSEAMAGFPFVHALMLASIPIIVAFARPSRLQRAANEVIERLDDPRVIGVILDTLALDEVATSQNVRAALKRLLPKVRTGDSGILTEAQWKILLGQLDDCGEPSFALILIDAIQQIGDERAIPHLAPLADGKGIGASSTNVQFSAKACIELLADRSINGRPGRTLLRPISESIPDESLLRSARSAESSTATLLKSAQTSTTDFEVD